MLGQSVVKTLGVAVTLTFSGASPMFLMRSVRVSVLLMVILPNEIGVVETESCGLGLPPPPEVV